MGKPLTMKKANEIARGKVRVFRDPVDPRLWQCDIYREPRSDVYWATECHEPMDEDAFRMYIATWCD